MIVSCLRAHAEGVVLSLQVQPRSSSNQIVGVHNHNLKVKLTSPPVDGAANKACCSFLAKLCSIPKAYVVIMSGETARQKRILLKTITVAELQQIIETALK